MKILNVNVGGFRNVENVKLELDKFNALIALNNFGKSNVIDAVEFGIDFINFPKERKLKLMATKSIIPINKHIDNKPYEFDITFQLNYQKRKYQVNYGFSFDWIKNKGKGREIKEEHLKIKEVDEDLKYTSYIKRNKKEALYLSSISGRCDKKIKVDKEELVVNKLNNFDNLFYFHIIERLNEIRVPFVNTLQHPDKLFRRLSSGVVRTGYSLDLPDNNDVAFFIYSLKKLKPKLYSLFEDSVKSLLKDVEDFEPIEIDFKNEVDFESDADEIPMDFPDKIYDIRLKEANNNQQANIGSLSSGSQKIFYIIAFAIAAELNKIPLISFEELENSIHPGLLQKLLIILDGLVTNTSIMTSSHSPYLIQYLDIDKIKIGIPNDKGLAVFKEIKKAKFKRLLNIAEEEGISAGDLIFDRLIECNNGEYELFNEFCD